MSITAVDTSKSSKESNTGKASTSLWLLLAAFILPIVLAKCALTYNWLNYGVTNKGVLIDQPLTLKALGIENHDFEQHWLIMFNVPKNCSTLCEQTLLSLSHTIIALGRERGRVLPVALVSTTPSDSAKQSPSLSLLEQHNWQLIQLPEQARKYLTSSQVIIVDPMENIVLTHNSPEVASALAQFGKNILADMKKLLKYSRIG